MAHYQTAIHHIKPTFRGLTVSLWCHGALCLHSGHTQQRVHIGTTVFTPGIYKRSPPQVLLAEPEDISADAQNDGLC